MKRRIPVMAAAVFATALIAGSCFEPGSSPCQDGSVCPRNFKCTATGDACIPVESHCGDSVKDPDEVCDDGNVKDTDGCSHDCKSDETCGNGVKDVAVGELCDDGNRKSGDGCSANCRSIEGCGNGFLDLGEECDDNNDAGDDNCPPTCKIAFCGDGFVNDAGRREQCDDIVESVRCNGNCTWASCGDSVLNSTAGEECDLGPVDTRTCRHDCKISFCGDLYVNGDAGEVCDDVTRRVTRCAYGTQTCPVCNDVCTAVVTVSGPYCGDGSTDPLPDGGTEECDDSSRDASSCQYGTRSCTACSPNCTTRTLTGPYCGDDNVDPLPGGGAEQCDDSSRDASSCQYDTPSCTACSPDCTTRTLTGPSCGDHNRDIQPDGGLEPCDDNTTGWTACPYGTPSCNACLATCQGSQSLTGPYCGDGRTTNGEACDDGNGAGCGTCSANCTQSQPGSAAIGSITLVVPNSIVDGETFTLNDGVNQEVFEFDKGDGDGGANHVLMDISGQGGRDGVATVVNGAITTETNAGRLTIASTRSNHVVNLTNTQRGTAGNQTITKTPTAIFTVSGMSGGSAFDCPLGTGCVGDSDCAIGLTCQDAGAGLGSTCL